VSFPGIFASRFQQGRPILDESNNEKRCALADKYGFMRLRIGVRVVPGALNCCNTVMNRSRMTIIYSGHVQGVGFRYCVKSTALGFEVSGSVRNLPDGRVELVAEGLRLELEAFRQAIRDSGMEHFIRNEDVRWSETRGGFRGFEILS
jgi:acylphosphatase